MAADFEHLALTLDGPVGTLELNRPEKLNALSPVLLEELAEAARLATRARDVRALVVSGRGRAFCAGFDLTAFAGMDDETGARETADLGRAMADAIEQMRPLTVAALHGRCVGGGLVLAAACDLRIAASDTIFAIPEVDLGIPLAWGGVPRLVRELGPALTKELVITCRPFGADEARTARFLNAVAEPEELPSAARAMAESLAARPPAVAQLVKRQVNAAAAALGPTAGATLDADLLLAAQADPRNRAASEAYLAARRRPA